ncbi:hypothetical protein CUC08_Gglean001819 [Alternaria sp. MG1]|nr:hypothetical protein CUC08_Gglean001819 [Alternaria sp. MG1]
MKYLTTVSAALSLILSTTAAATPGPLINADLLPRDMSAMPRGITSLLTRDAMMDRRALEKRAGCFQACNSGCGGCTSMGCLSGCQINCSICCEIHNGNCTDCGTQYECDQ